MGSGLGNSTPWSASPRRFRCTNSRQKRHYVASVRQTSLICIKNFHFRRSAEELRRREYHAANRLVTAFTAKTNHQKRHSETLVRDKSLSRVGRGSRWGQRERSGDQPS